MCRTMGRGADGCGRVWKGVDWCGVSVKTCRRDIESNCGDKSNLRPTSSPSSPLPSLPQSYSTHRLCPAQPCLQESTNLTATATYPFTTPHQPHPSSKHHAIFPQGTTTPHCTTITPHTTGNLSHYTTSPQATEPHQSRPSSKHHDTSPQGTTPHSITITPHTTGSLSHQSPHHVTTSHSTSPHPIFTHKPRRSRRSKVKEETEEVGERKAKQESN